MIRRIERQLNEHQTYPNDVVDAINKMINDIAIKSYHDVKIRKVRRKHKNITKTNKYADEMYLCWGEQNQYELKCWLDGNAFRFDYYYTDVIKKYRSIQEISYIPIDKIITGPDIVPIALHMLNSIVDRIDRHALSHELINVQVRKRKH